MVLPLCRPRLDRKRASLSDPSPSKPSFLIIASVSGDERRPIRARSASCYVLAATVKTVADADMLCRLVSRPLRGALSTEPAFVMRLVAVRFESDRAYCFASRVVRCSRAVRSRVAIGAIEVGEFGGEFVAHRKFARSQWALGRPQLYIPT